MKILSRISLLFASLLLATSVYGAGSDSSSSSSSASASEPQSAYDVAKGQVEDGDYESAIPELLRIARDDNDPNAYNLLGFSHRKLGQLDAALKYYDKALAVDPKHRGAHEYVGQAYLELGNLAKAQEHLAFLDKDCAFGCDEYDSLKEAVAAYEKRQ